MKLSLGIKTSLIVATLAFGIGCSKPTHVVERAANTAEAAEYGLELDECNKKAEAILSKSPKDLGAAQKAYSDCAAAADAKHQVKP